MATLTGVRDLSRRIQQLVYDAVKDLGVKKSDIVFDSPGEIESSTSPKISIFLYQIKEDPYLLNTPPESVKNAAGNFEITRPPLKVECKYIFTVYSSERETEILISESIMQLFHEVKVMEPPAIDFLSFNRGEEIHINHTPFEMEEMNKFWAIFPGRPYKLTLAYTFSPVIIWKQVIDVGYKVKVKTLDVDYKTKIENKKYDS